MLNAWKNWKSRWVERRAKGNERDDPAERGATATEYIIILGLIIGIAYVAVDYFGNSMKNYYNNQANTLFPTK